MSGLSRSDECECERERVSGRGSVNASVKRKSNKEISTTMVVKRKTMTRNDGGGDGGRSTIERVAGEQRKMDCRRC